MVTWHGTTNGYTNRRCRCDLCREANNAAARRNKKKRREGYTYRDEGDHGTPREYQRGCKCDPCRLAYNKVQRDTRKGDPPKKGVCEICNASGMVFWDHVHDSGLFRGWLCEPCNQGLGLFRDSPFLLEGALQWLSD